MSRQTGKELRKQRKKHDERRRRAELHAEYEKRSMAFVYVAGRVLKPQKRGPKPIQRGN